MIKQHLLTYDLLTLFIIANIVDAITTVRAISYGSEGNPLLSIGFESIGMEATLGLKVLAAIAIGIALKKFNRVHLLKWPTLVITIVAVSNSLQTLV